MCILKEFFAFRAKSTILFFFPTVETYHQFYCPFFLGYARSNIFVHTIGKDSKQKSNSENNFGLNDWLNRNYRYLCSMRKLLCPQCKIAAMYVKNEQGDRLLVYVLEDGEVVSKDPEASMEGFDLTEVYCLGCSWHGSPKRLVKR